MKWAYLSYYFYICFWWFSISIWLPMSFDRLFWVSIGCMGHTEVVLGKLLFSCPVNILSICALLLVVIYLKIYCHKLCWVKELGVNGVQWAWKWGMQSVCDRCVVSFSLQTPKWHIKVPLVLFFWWYSISIGFSFFWRFSISICPAVFWWDVLIVYAVQGVWT